MKAEGLEQLIAAVDQPAVHHARTELQRANGRHQRSILFREHRAQIEQDAPIFHAGDYGRVG
jgi:hypothetical protein